MFNKRICVRDWEKATSDVESVLVLSRHAWLTRDRINDRLRRSRNPIFSKMMSWTAMLIVLRHGTGIWVYRIRTGMVCVRFEIFPERETKKKEKSKIKSKSRNRKRKARSLWMWGAQRKVVSVTLPVAKFFCCCCISFCCWFCSCWFCSCWFCSCWFC